MHQQGAYMTNDKVKNLHFTNLKQVYLLFKPHNSPHIPHICILSLFTC
jgi:hypothetical protein